MRAAIARLPKKQRATLILRVYHELPHEQIAGILGSSVGAVKANFFHALNNLKKLLWQVGIIDLTRAESWTWSSDALAPRRAAHVEACAALPRAG